MVKIQTLDDCVLELNGERKCVFCGTTLADGEVCTCNRYKSAIYNFSQIDGYNARIAEYQQRVDTILANMPAPRYMVAGAIVPVPTEPEPPAEECGEGIEETTNGGGSGNLGEEQGGEE